MTRVQVYKSRRKADTYVYLEQGVATDTLPEALQHLLGALEPVLDIPLTAERALARYSGAEVLAAIAEHGFFLQLPPEPMKEPAC